MRFIFSYVKRHIGLVLFAISLKTAAAMGELMLPYILEHLIDDVVPLADMKRVILWGLGMVLLAVLVRQLNVKANRGAVKVARESIYAIRKDLFWKSLDLSGNQVDEFGLPSLTSRMTSDSYNLQNFIQSIQAMGVRAPIMLVGGITITMTMDPGLAAILCVMVPILITIVVFVSFKGIPLYEKVQRSVDDIVRIMRENITGIRVVKSLSKEPYEKARFEGSNKEMVANDMKAGTVMAMPGPIMTLFLNMGLTLVVIIGARRVDAGQIQPGVILAFLTYFNMVLQGVMGLNRVFMLMSKANASANRIEAVVHARQELTPISEEEAAKPDPARYDGSEYIIFDHVDFSYNEDSVNGAENNNAQFAGLEREKCLYDIHFALKKGESLGIIGATGAGKTTIINLLMRFYDTSSGHIFVDGKDVRTYRKDILHEMFGVVFQNDVIFADSLHENIAFGRDVGIEEIRRAAEDARASEFIEAYGDSYEHQAVIHGANLSGGQRQRTLIARALVANPDILVLDDSSSALDYKTDAALRKAIRENHDDATTIIIAQRISSILSLDHIMVLDEGRMIGYGTHEELLENCPMYRDIYNTQMGDYVNG
ncbi:MAG: ABC transporter ATP-binding protein [Lachnospiraceae bacterium]|nr:ABC transporter ATP-binding protein [Lachnospiraceae bacterium]